MRALAESSEHRHMSLRALALHAQRIGEVFVSPSTWYRMARKLAWGRGLRGPGNSSSLAAAVECGASCLLAVSRGTQAFAAYRLQVKTGMQVLLPVGLLAGNTSQPQEALLGALLVWANSQANPKMIVENPRARLVSWTRWKEANAAVDPMCLDARPALPLGLRSRAGRMESRRWTPDL